VATDSDVLNVGSTALAYDMGAVAATVHGVAFSGSLAQSVTLAITGSYFTTTSGSHSISTMSSDFTSVLNTNYGTTTTPITLTFSNLAANEIYELQLFSGIALNGSGNTLVTSGTQSVNLAYGPGNNTTNTGDSDVVLTFQTGVTPLNEVVTITHATGSTYGLINAVNLRDMGTSVVPEPSTWVMLGLGGIGLAAFVRRRKLAAVRA